MNHEQPIQVLTADPQPEHTHLLYGDHGCAPSSVLFDPHQHQPLLLRAGLELPFEPVPTESMWTCLHCGRRKRFRLGIRGEVVDYNGQSGLHFYPIPLDDHVANQRECRGFTVVCTVQPAYEGWRQKQLPLQRVGHDYPPLLSFTTYREVHTPDGVKMRFRDPSPGGYSDDPMPDPKKWHGWHSTRESFHHKSKVVHAGRGICPNPGWHWLWDHEEEAKQQALFLSVLPAWSAFRIESGCGAYEAPLPFPAKWLGGELPMVLAFARLRRLESVVQKLVENTHQAGVALSWP